MNSSVLKVNEDFSLERVYRMFRHMGLRQLIVVDLHHQVKGIITRKDLLPYYIQEKTSVLSSELDK